MKIRVIRQKSVETVETHLMNTVSISEPAWSKSAVYMSRKKPQSQAAAW